MPGTPESAGRPRTVALFVMPNCFEHLISNLLARILYRSVSFSKFFIFGRRGEAKDRTMCCLSMIAGAQCNEVSKSSSNERGAM
jgi:hypothetical protein